MIEQLPKAWKHVKLKDISENIQYGYTESSSKVKVGPKFLRITDIQQNKVDWDDVPYCKIHINTKNKYLLQSGDLVFARTGATVGKSFLIKGSIPEAVFASYLIRVRVNKEIEERFLSYFFHSRSYWTQITEGQVGIGQPNVNGTKLGQLIIPLPPKSIQQAIVSKIEELFSELDKGIENLLTAQQQLKTYRQSVLKWAFEGRLTNESTVENQLPKDWKKLKILDVADVNPKLPNKENINDNLEVQFLPMKLVEEIINKVHLKEIKQLKEVKKGSYTPFINGDIIFAKVTPCMENGKIAVVENLKNGIGYGSSEFHVLRCTELISNKYLFYFVVQDDFRNEAQHAMTGAVGLRRVPKQFIETHEIPLPLLTKQQMIVQEIESRLSIADKMQETITQSLQQSEALKQSILKMAFEGRLV